MRQIVRKNDRRRHSRSPISHTTPILWEDENGHEQLVHGRLIDVSVSGAKIWVPLRLPTRALVTFYCAALAVGGRGTVRYCNPTKGGFEAGLELGSGTGWRDQNTDLRNLAAGVNEPSQLGPREAMTETVTGEVPKTRP